MSATLLRLADAGSPVQRIGRVTGVVGLEVTVRGVAAAIGDIVRLGTDGRVAEVIAIRGDELVVTPIGPVSGIACGLEVEPVGDSYRIPIGPELIGCVIDGQGRLLDGSEWPDGMATTGIDGRPPNPLERQRITEPLSLGVRAIDTLLTCGRGQRIGVFAGSGVGKSSLLGMMARGTAADVVVVALVGERGREVREFLEDDLGPEGRENAIVVVATSDEPALVRLQAAFAATRIAEWFADDGKDVLLVMDSLTRVATAQREVGLTAGEPPTTRGYPPSVFAMLPRLLERAGPMPRGSITGVYSVLVEGDDLNEPITDHARSILDGHLVLSRRLASAGHYPTIDVLESASRLSGKVSSTDQLALAAAMRRLLHAWEEGRDLVEVGAYAAGTNPDLDMYLARRAEINAFLQQDLLETADWNESWTALAQVFTDA